MSQYEKKPNSGAVFKNDQKQDEKDRDYSGDALIGGIDYWVSCYINTAKSGKKYLSLRFKPKNDRSERQPGPKKTTAEEMDDFIPDF